MIQNTNGEITALRTNMAEVNRLKMLTVELLSQELLEMDTEELSIPLGSILMPEFFAGKGPGLPILTPAGTERVDVASTVVVAETVIVGSVPQSYFQIGADGSAVKKG